MVNPAAAGDNLHAGCAIPEDDVKAVGELGMVAERHGGDVGEDGEQVGSIVSTGHKADALGGEVELLDGRPVLLAAYDEFELRTG